MCGLFGAFNIKSFFSNKEFRQFVGLTDMVRYRGPNASGYLSIRTKGNLTVGENDSFDIFLGHRRLSIIDLSSQGNQPLTNDGNIWIVFNGEIFNYIELREDLQAKGYHFMTKTDTEVILNTYKAYGEEGFSHFNGMWAFALVDVVKKKLILSRDRFSIKPLYYIISNHIIYFASEIKQLLPLLKEREINKKLLFMYLKQGLADVDGETFFRNVQKVKPRHSLIISLSKGTLREVRYWDYQRKRLPTNEQDAVEQFRELFIDSVKIRLRSDVPMGILLSGGLDSSSIAVIANSLSKKKLRCFSVVSSNEKYSEEKFINVLKEEVKLRVTKLFLNSASWEKLEHTLWHQEEPFTSFSVVLHHQMMEEIKKKTNITVLLSGQGGDEILCGYRKFFFFYLSQELRSAHLAPVLKNIILSLWNRTVLWQFSLSESKRYLPFFQKYADPIDTILSHKEKLKMVGAGKNLRERQIQDIDYYSVPYLTHYEDRNSMAHSLEIRLPFLDHRIVNFVLNVPDSLKIQRGWTKYILRAAIRELPRPIAWRPDKQGFINPEEKWLKHDFREDIITLFKTSRLHSLGLIDAPQFLTMYDKFLRGDKRIWHADITRFLIAELWVRKFICS